MRSDPFYDPSNQKPKRTIGLSSNIIILGVAIFVIFACFALAGPLGLFDWLASFFQSLDPDTAVASGDGPPVLLGLYTNDALQITAYEIENFDEWLEDAGLDKGISIAGTYMDFEFHNPNYNVHKELDAAWDLGYTPFINLTAYQRTMEQVAHDPEFEEIIRKWALAFARWSRSGHKRAFIAPLQEMNGGWVRYGEDPENFKIAWQKIQKIFYEEGVPEDAVSWVFAPNAWSEEGHEFEVYYPGHSTVDVVAFSSMNFGGCVDWGPQWDTFETIMEQYLERFREMAPGKPIFLAQMGSVAVGPRGKDDGLKNMWLQETFRKLAEYPGVKAILYVNVLKTEVGIELCKPVDWRVYDKHSGLEYKGFIDAVRSPRFAYWAPDSDEMIEIGFNRPTGTQYIDVWKAHPFSGDEDPWYYDYVNALANNSLAVGCKMENYTILGEEFSLEYFCPKNPVTRAEMAVFIELVTHGPGYWPPTPTGRFEDVPMGHWAAGWIEQLVNDGISEGCDETHFCPDQLVSRAEIATMLGKAKYWPMPFEPSAASGDQFLDVGSEFWAADWIEELASIGVVEGCKVGRYCPEEAVSRAELAVFLVKTFNIPLQNAEGFTSE